MDVRCRCGVGSGSRLHLGLLSRDGMRRVRGVPVIGWFAPLLQRALTGHNERCGHRTSSTEVTERTNEREEQRADRHAGGLDLGVGSKLMWSKTLSRGSLDGLLPVGVPVCVGAIDAQREHGPGVVGGLPRTRALEALLHDVAMGALDLFRNRSAGRPAMHLYILK
jgi:hypothetical protein